MELRERKETLEVAAEEARGLLKERWQLLDSADTIATFAEEMSDFLKTSELIETRATAEGNWVTTEGVRVWVVGYDGMTFGSSWHSGRDEPN